MMRAVAAAAEAASVHATAVVSAGARLGAGTVVGPYCVVGPGVRTGRDVKLGPHVVVDGQTKLGDACELHAFSVVGGLPQDRKHREEERASRLEIGAGCVVREHVTVNGGSSGAGALTRVGAGSLLLAGSHVGHDCRVGRGVVISNRVQLAGHICIGDNATLGGAVSVRQFVNIGCGAMVGGASAVDKHVLPFSVVSGNRARLKGANLVGLRRRAVPRARIRELQRALDALREARTSSRPLVDVAQGLLLAAPADSAALRELLAFVLGEDDHANRAKPGQYDWGWPQRKLGITL